MKSLLKNIGLFSVVLLTFSMGFLQEETFAAEKDLDVLYEKAKNGISDLSDREMQKLLENFDIQLSVNESIKDFGLVGLNKIEEPQIQTYATAEILESDGDTQLIAVSTFSDISLIDSKLDVSKYNPNVISPSSWDGEKTDHTGSVTVYAILYVESKYVDGYPMHRITGGSGGWTILDYRNVTSITDRYVSFEQIGSGIGGAVIQSWGPTLLTSNNFTMDISSSSKLMYKNNSAMGIILSAKIVGKNTSWDLRMNLPYGQSPL